MSEPVAKVAWVRDPELNFMALVILDEASGDTIEVQRSIEFDEQDVRLGLDTYCLVRGDASHYGGLLNYEVTDQRLCLLLSAEAAATLQLSELIEIEIDERSAALLRTHLPELLR